MVGCVWDKSQSVTYRRRGGLREQIVSSCIQSDLMPSASAVLRESDLSPEKALPCVQVLFRVLGNKPLQSPNPPPAQLSLSEDSVCVQCVSLAWPAAWQRPCNGQQCRSATLSLIHIWYPQKKRYFAPRRYQHMYSLKETRQGPGEGSLWSKSLI